MTIRFAGHIVSLSEGQSKTIRIAILGAADRTGNTPIVIEATHAEAGSYYPGMAVEIGITPQPK